MADIIDSMYYEAQCYIRGTSLAATYRYQNAEKSGYTYYVQNAHGDVVNLTDADGAVTRTYRYDAFGVEFSPVSGDVNVFRYCGEYFDTETGTIYLRARYYQASIGRFTQRDTYTGNRFDSLSLNLYTYCSNNPVIYIDPSGHKKEFRKIKRNYNMPYDKPLPYQPDDWNDDKHKTTTNCYAYAFNLLENPITNQPFSEELRLQPGLLSGKISGLTDEEYFEFECGLLTGTDEANKQFINVITEDARAIGLNFQEYNISLKGGYKVALAIRPVSEYTTPDYHWYRSNGDGTWSHKQGSLEVTNREWKFHALIFPPFIPEYQEQTNIIVNPEEATKRAGYTDFVGYYYISPLEE